LRVRPQDIPSSRALYLLLAFCSLFAGIVGALMLGQFSVFTLFRHLLDIFLVSVLFWFTLSYLHKTPRFLQATSAIFASQIVLNILLMPLLILLGGDQESMDLRAFVLFIYTLMIPWGLLVSGHIIRHTFDVSLNQGFLWALAYFIFYLWLVEGLFA